MPSAELEDVVGDETLTVAETEERVAAVLRAEPDRGAATAVEALVEGDDVLTAFAAGYLAVVPGAAQPRRAGLRRVLDERPDRIDDVAPLVRFADRDLARALVRRCLDVPDAHPEAMLQATTAFPDLIREESGAAPDPDDDIQLWPGAPDDWVAAARGYWHAEPDVPALERVAVTRTDTARHTLAALRAEVPDDLVELYDLLLENAGVPPEADGPAPVYPHTLLGLVTDREAGPHPMGSGVGHDVPLCPMCDRPAERVVTLDRAALPFDVAGVADPSFFRFPCDCDVIEYLYVRITADGIEPVMTETGPSGGDAPLGRLALELSEHPNQFGRADDAVPGFAGHQVGGYPPWLAADRFPRCSECRRGMRFLVCVDSGMTLFGRLPHDGTVFGFWCERCSVSVTVVQRLD